MRKANIVKQKQELRLKIKVLSNCQKSMEEVDQDSHPQILNKLQNKLPSKSHQFKNRRKDHQEREMLFNNNKMKKNKRDKKRKGRREKHRKNKKKGREQRMLRRETIHTFISGLRSKLTSSTFYSIRRDTLTVEMPWQSLSQNVVLSMICSLQDNSWRFNS